jgi:probable aminopeptidase NPEPL1
MPVQTTICYDAFDTSEPNDILFVGRRAALEGRGIPGEVGADSDSFAAMLERAEPGDAGSGGSLWVGSRRVFVGVLPEVCSRHNSPSRAWAIPDRVRQASGDRDLDIVLCVDDAKHARAAALAAARGLPLFSAKSGSVSARTVRIMAATAAGPVADEDAQALIDGVRLAARLFDMPTEVLHTDAFVEEARAVAAAVGAEITVIQGEDLRDQGFGGLWGVGKAARNKPALAILKWQPEGATRSVAWVGKGIVYDTGGLSIKSKTGMPGMKGDMGGAAAVLGAFYAAASSAVDYAITAVLCLAENAVGPDATRPDDILVMKSGKTVEINNTDAEGRLVLADGVAWCAAEAGADLIVDMATLTGAALVATGKVHAALYCNEEMVERAAVVVGRAIGEPCHPLPYAPELFRKEFKSTVADMKNSVKDRGNAQASCAGQFIGNHLPDPMPSWLHVDIAGPAWGSGERGSGYGVGLLVMLGAGPVL